MQRGSQPVVGILAGGGSLPREIADVLHAQGQNPVIVGLEGEVRPRDFAGHDFTLVNWGRIGQLLRTFKQKGVTDLVIVGSVTRPDLRAIRTDWGFWTNLPRIYAIVKAGGDDSVLRRVVHFFESHDFAVRGPADVAPVLVIGEGAYGRLPMTEALRRDFEIGREVVARLAPFDVGQSVVAAQGRVLAIEGAEGTDAMLKRVGVRRDGARGGVLVKWPKPGQELRVDMPAIGPNTIAGVAAAGLNGIVVQAGATLAAQRGDMADAANAQGIFVAGVPATTNTISKTVLTDDADIGMAVLDALSGLVESRGVIAVRRHVLAVESGEGLADLVNRAAGLKQWGHAKKRRGVLAVALLTDVDRGVIEAAGAAGYEWIVARSAGEDAREMENVISAAGLKLDVRGRAAR